MCVCVCVCVCVNTFYLTVDNEVFVKTIYETGLCTSLAASGPSVSYTLPCSVFTHADCVPLEMVFNYQATSTAAGTQGSARSTDPSPDGQYGVRLTRGQLLFAACLASQQHAMVSIMHVLPHSDRSCRANYLTQSQYIGAGPASPSADPITLGNVATGVPNFKSLV